MVKMLILTFNMIVIKIYELEGVVHLLRYPGKRIFSLVTNFP